MEISHGGEILIAGRIQTISPTGYRLNTDGPILHGMAELSVFTTSLYLSSKAHKEYRVRMWRAAFGELCRPAYLDESTVFGNTPRPAKFVFSKSKGGPYAESLHR